MAVTYRYRHLILAAVLVLTVLSRLSKMQDTPPVEPQDLEDDLCGVAMNCRECIALDPSCGWCGDLGYGIDTKRLRCDTLPNLTNSTCRDVTFPRTSVTITQNDPFSNAGEGASTEAVQVAPQKIRLKLRAKETVEFTVSVRQAEDYPVDLYYVMDLSYSMKDDLDNLKGLATILAQEMGKITKNFRLGFGSFVEKTVAPFVDTTTSGLEEPCPDCMPPYNFRNHLPLDVNTALFSVKVKETSVSGNEDLPEAGLDALMQVSVCKDQIGWLPKARHIVVYTSDYAFHFAGDAKLGGIVRPNDGKCHLNPKTGFNDMANEFDYPSIGHLNYRMREQNVIPIFAVVRNQIGLYQNLAQFIEGSTVGALDSDSANVVDLIKANYAKITSRVELVDNAPENLAVTYTSHCLNEGENPGSKVCTGLRIGETVRFSVNIEATACSDTRQQTFSIGPIGFDEAVEIIVEVACDCDCKNSKVPNSAYCTNGNGTLSCGQCLCDPGRYGKLCECSGNDDVGTLFRDKYENVTSCRANSNSTSSIACSGRGECICGECACFERPDRKEVVSGRYCECDNFSCNRYNGELCGGPDRGMCMCDEKQRRSACKCQTGYAGPACECSTATHACVASNGLICNGRGRCKCNQCVCQSSFQGATCEVCKTCIGKCSSYKPCVECQVFGVDISPADCSKCNVVVVIEKDLPTMNGSSIPVCVFPGGNSNCSSTYSFVYETLSNGTILVHLDEDPANCGDVGVSDGGDGEGPVVETNASGRDLLLLVIGIISAIVIIGIILLLLLRVATYLHDKREYTRFKKEQASAVWDKAQNPIYKPSTSTFINPTYGK